MTIDIAAELRQTFELASLRLESKHLKTGDDWREARAISERFAKARLQADRSYRAEYDTRVEIARKRLIDVAAAKKKDFIYPWARRDRFDNQAIRRQAVREVRGAHANDLGRIDLQESQALETLLERAEGQSRLRDNVRNDFNRSTDRRSKDEQGPGDRRMPHAAHPQQIDQTRRINMTENDQMRIAEARSSFTGKTLTDAQFDESWALAGIMERGVRKSGSFKEKLGDYAHAFARTERFDVMKGETIIRDIFKARYGQTMNQMREALMVREAAVREQAKPEALNHARQIGAMISEGETMPFYQAFDRTAGQLAQTFDITEAGAKTFMKEAFQEVEGRDLYETGKALEKAHHEPAREAAKQSRAAPRSQSQTRTRM